jgi:exosortase/archaeosortase family protein
MYVFYLIFTPLTVYSVYFLLNLFYSASLSGVEIFVRGLKIVIIDACVAGSAYYLLFMLNLSVPKISLKTRTKMIFYSFGILFLLNVFRILLLSILVVNGSVYFDFVHKLFWYVLSTVFVVGIWFWEVYRFNIKEIPFFSDLKFLYNDSAFKKGSK